ncbi:MAG: sulfotransferase family 2 domain-containing protein [Devosia sp.]
MSTLDAAPTMQKRGSRHFVCPSRRLIVFLFHATLGNRIGEFLMDAVDRQAFFMTSMEIEAAYADYDRCVFVRNPYSRVVSLYERIQEGMADRYHTLAEVGISRESTFEDLVEAIVRNPMRISAFWPFISQVKAEPAFVGRFELLGSEWRRFQDVTGLDLPEMYSPREHEYRHFYSATTRELISEAYREDLEVWGYAF